MMEPGSSTEGGAEVVSVRQSYITGDLSIECGSPIYKDFDDIDIIYTPNHKVLLILHHPAILYVEGVIRIKCIIGKVSSYGHIICPHSERLTLYSLPPDNAVGIHSVPEAHSKSFDYILSKLSRFGLNLMPATKLARQLASERGSALALARSNDIETRSLLEMLKRNNFDLYPTPISMGSRFDQFECILNCRLRPDNRDYQRKLKIGEPWEQLYARLMTPQDETFMKEGESGLRIAVCGGKAVGKSTLLKFLINKALNEYEKVLLLDFDIGQAECSMPGCISATIIDKPLLGPNYTHLLKPIRSLYVGHIDPTKCLHLYKQSVQNLIEYCRSNEELSRIPWFANTMGFCLGLGIPLTATVVVNFQPTHLVQIHSYNYSNNFPALLSPGYMMNNCKGTKNLNYKVETFRSIAETTERNIIPNQRRNIVILTYLFQTIKETTIFMVPKSQVYVMICGDNASIDNDYILRSGDLVVFTDSSINEGVHNCLGFGVVRSYTQESDVIFFTGIIKGDTSRIKGIVVGTVKVPESIMTSDPELTGTIPYFALRNVPKEPLSAAKRQTKCLFS